VIVRLARRGQEAFKTAFAIGRIEKTRDIGGGSILPTEGSKQGFRPKDVFSPDATGLAEQTLSGREVFSKSARDSRPGAGLV